MNNQKKQPKKSSVWPIIIILIGMAAANIGEIGRKVDGTLLVFILSVIVIIASIALGLRLRMKLGTGRKAVPERVTAAGHAASENWTGLPESQQSIVLTRAAKVLLSRMRPALSASIPGKTIWNGISRTASVSWTTG